MSDAVNNAVNTFVRGIVESALNPLLDLLSTTLLTTPSPEDLPRIGELWNTSWQIMLVCYGVLILLGGILVMAYETVQTEYTVKEILPRIVVGFFAGALSLWIATQAVKIANALSHAVIGDGLDVESASQELKNLIFTSLDGPIFLLFIGLVLAALLLVLLVTYVVRVALTIILIAGAPLALMAHALPQTEGIAVWWWKALAACLAIQVGQSLTLVTALKVFLTPSGVTSFGLTGGGLVNLLVALAIVYVLIKIPFWFLGALRGNRSGSLARRVITYQTFRLLRP